MKSIVFIRYIVFIKAIINSLVISIKSNTIIIIYNPLKSISPSRNTLYYNNISIINIRIYIIYKLYIYNPPSIIYSLYIYNSSIIIIFTNIFYY